MRTPKIPAGARRVRTYSELGRYLIHFAEGYYSFLWVVGRPGTGKSQEVQSATRGRRVCSLTGGQLTPARFYVECYRHRNEPIILDDAEQLLDHGAGRRLVAALGEVNPIKHLSYATTTHSRFLGDVPDSFSTTSPLCILANRVTAHVEVQSRGIILYFDPANLEIHRAVARWYWDQEIHDWFGEHLYRLSPLETRWYVMAFQDKRAGLDWQRIILDTHAPSRAVCLVQDLERDPAHPTREDKRRQFDEMMGNSRGKSRASYFRLRRRLEDQGRLLVETVAPIPLRRTRPPGTPSLLELEAMEAAGSPAQSEHDLSPADVPTREAFAQPVRGQAPQPAPPPRPVLDDTVGWEGPTTQDDEDEE